MNNQIPLCLYHKNCLDGLASAWVAWKFHKGKIELQAIQYGDPIPAVHGRKVYVLDFSFKADVLLELDRICDIVLLDHHATAIKEFGTLTPDQRRELKGEYVFDVTQSGAMLSWKYFFPNGDIFPDSQPPSEIKMVQDRDLWKFEIPQTRLWTIAAYSYPLTVESFERFVNVGVNEMLKEGEVLSRKNDQDVTNIAKSARYMMIDGMVLPVVNAPSSLASDLGHKLSEDEAAAVVYTDGKDGRIFSLRSRTNGLAVNELAERFGGGGHPGAAGFKIMFTDRRFKSSHLYLYSKGYWWRWVKTTLSKFFKKK